MPQAESPVEAFSDWRESIERDLAASVALESIDCAPLLPEVYYMVEFPQNGNDPAN